MKILIVDDELKVRELLYEMLSRFGYECRTATNGREALSILEEDYFSMVISDIRMPEMNGQEALKKIREMEKEKGILSLDGVKVIITSALGDGKNVFGAFRTGCEGYLVKPIDKAKILGEVLLGI